MSKSTIQNIINHIVFVVDKSGSMGVLAKDVIKVFDSQIEYLARRSKELNQETRVTVYQFGNTCECLIFDTDVLRLPSLAAHYSVGGGTALIDGTLKALSELAETPQRYGDHSFLLYVLTDGEENQSRNKPEVLAKTINNLPENWTVAVMVPNQDGVYEAKKFGFPANNIAVWSTTSKGVSEIGNTMQTATDNYMISRSRGVRATRSLFQLDTNALKTTNVRAVLQELPPNNYFLFPVHKDAVIKPFVESWTQAEYRIGSAYFQLTKPETIQAYKQIAVQDKTNGKVYSGTQARQILGLPNHEVKVSPADFGNYTVFVQSSSVNRKLVAGTQLIVIK